MPKLLPVHEVTTRHARSVYPLQAGSTLPAAGCLIGWDAFGGGGFAFDPWSLYRSGRVTDFCALILGQKGRGKSALTKAYLSRQVGVFGRQCWIVDPKGEYDDLARALDLVRLRLEPRGSVRLNPLDAPEGAPSDEVLDARTDIVVALAATALTRPLSQRERNAVSEAISDIHSDEMLLGAVVDALLSPTPAMASALHCTQEALAAEARDVALALRTLVSGSLRGMFDAPSTVKLTVDGPGGVIDLSPVQRSPDALAPTMVCAMSWLARVVPSPPPPYRILVVDEAWQLLRLETLSWLNAVSKLSRKWQVQLLLVLHRLSDFAGSGDAGSQASALAEGLVSDIETRIIFATAAGEVPITQRVLGLSTREAEMLPTLQRGRCLWHVGRHRALIDVALTDRERHMSDTDSPTGGTFALEAGGDPTTL